VTTFFGFCRWRRIPGFYCYCDGNETGRTNTPNFWKDEILSHIFSRAELAGFWMTRC
jgi:hypothetical protein